MAIRWFLVRCLLIPVLLIAGTSPCHAVRLAVVGERQELSLAEAVTAVAAADVVFIGESHDNAWHHRVQLDILTALLARGKPLAIGLEMFTSADQGALDEWVAGRLDEEVFQAVYKRNWSYSWTLYRDLFLLARDRQIPLVALNAPKEVMAKLMSRGPRSLAPEEIPPHTTWKLNQAQTLYLSRIARQAFGTPPSAGLAARLAQAQSLRNQWMAWQIARYRQAHENLTVVVLAGTWHAVKNGVPALLPTYLPLSYRVILPELPELSAGQVTIDEADYLLLPDVEGQQNALPVRAD